MPHTDLDARRTTPLLVGLVIVAGCVAWAARWVQDDAFITFRYSANLVGGLGPVWNSGYAVEGYTNFLWMLVVAAALRAGIAPEVSSCAVGVLCFAASVFLVYRMALGLLSRRVWALIVAAIVATNYSFRMYATGGLETPLEATLTLALLLLAVEGLQARRLPLRRALAASLLAALALMTRLDSGLVVAVVLGCLGLVALRESSRTGPSRVVVASALVGPLLVLVGAWFAWKLSFYGRLLPNTFYAKVGMDRSATLARGVAYTGWMFVSYAWAPITLGVFLVSRVRGVPVKDLARLRSGELPLVVYGALWLAYVISVGGDVMEFRMLVPIIPVIVILMVDLFVRVFEDVRRVGAVSALLVVASVVHGLWFRKYVAFLNVNPIPVLAELGDPDPGANWKAVGLALRGAVSASPDLAIGISPAGAVPYFSRARSIDVLGLNDKWVPAHGYKRRLCTVCLGHARLATIDYMRQSRVHLLLGHPQHVSYLHPSPNPLGIVRAMFFGEDIDYENLPPSASLLRIPLHDDVAVAAAYIAPNPEVDRLIATGVWRDQPLFGAGRAQGGWVDPRTPR